MKILFSILLNLALSTAAFAGPSFNVRVLESSDPTALEISTVEFHTSMCSLNIQLVKLKKSQIFLTAEEDGGPCLMAGGSHTGSWVLDSRLGKGAYQVY
ncbi:MAG: hypothetical protein AB7H97_14995, partial [Pseudobdellovibrionaceae bacterium]